MNLALDSVSRANALRICFRSPFYIPLVQLSIPSNPVRSPLNLIRSPLDHYIIHLPSRVNHQTAHQIIQWSSDKKSQAPPTWNPGHSPTWRQEKVSIFQRGFYQWIGKSTGKSTGKSEETVVHSFHDIWGCRSVSPTPIYFGGMSQDVFQNWWTVNSGLPTILPGWYCLSQNFLLGREPQTLAENAKQTTPDFYSCTPYQFQTNVQRPDGNSLWTYANDTRLSKHGWGWWLVDLPIAMLDPGD